MAYVELQLRVEGDRQVRAMREDGAETFGPLRVPPIYRRLIAIFDYWLREKPKDIRRQDLEGLGALLYESLIGGEVEGFFHQTLNQISQSGSDRLRLQLVFREQALEMAGLPWEFLYCPESETRRGFFLASHSRLVLSRYLPLELSRPELMTPTTTLRWLVVVSQPQGLPAVLAEPVAEAIRELKDVCNLEVEQLDNPTIDALVDKNEAFQPHLLHFIGHGQFDRQEKVGSLALLQPDRETPDWIKDYIFAELFERHLPRLVFLHACMGGQIDFTSNFAGMASQLIRQGIPAVVAMQYPVTNRTAVSFSKIFYRRLAEGEPVDGAVQEARRRLTFREYGPRDFGTPVLYMRSRDGRILPPRPALVNSQ